MPMYIALMIHGSTLTPTQEYLRIFLLYPLVAGICLVTFDLKFKSETREKNLFFEQIGIPASYNLVLGLALYIVFPIGMVFSTMLYAHFSSGYNDVEWVVIVFGMLTVRELGSRFR